MNITDQDLEELMLKIPPLRGKETTIGLNKATLRNLTDQQFRILWHLPNLKVMCTPKTIEYINQRRKFLGLQITDHANISQDKAD